MFSIGISLQGQSPIKPFDSDGVPNYLDLDSNKDCFLNATTGVPSDLNNAGAGTESGEGVVITDIANYTDDAVGVLELKSTNKALILPTVADLNSLPATQPRMICYVQEIKSFAIFNRDKWAFWK